jgi:serine protease
VDTSTATQAVVVTARITDDLAGYAEGFLVGEVRFYSPSRGQFTDASFYYSREKISGTSIDATFRVTMPVPQFAEQGTWTADGFLIRDRLGNQRALTTAQIAASGFPTSFTQTGSAIADTTAPQLASFSFSPTSIDTASASQVVVVTARITDDIAGYAEGSLVGEVRFFSPSGSQFVDAAFYYSRDKISGTATDAIFQVTMTISQFAEQGTWTGSGFMLRDRLGNMRTIADLAAAGFPATFRNGP